MAKRKKSKSSFSPPWLWILGVAVGATAVFFYGPRTPALLPTPGQPVAVAPVAVEPAVRVAVPPQKKVSSPPGETIADSDRKKLQGILENREH